MSRRRQTIKDKAGGVEGEGVNQLNGLVINPLETGIPQRRKSNEQNKERNRSRGPPDQNTLETMPSRDRNDRTVMFESEHSESVLPTPTHGYPQVSSSHARRSRSSH